MSAREDARARAQKNSEREWQLALIYKRVFNTPDGREILTDLEDKFGWNRGSASYGTPTNDILLNEGMKNVIRHIHAKINQKPKSEEAKTTEAIHE